MLNTLNVATQGHLPNLTSLSLATLGWLGGEVLIFIEDNEFVWLLNAHDQTWNLYYQDTEWYFGKHQTQWTVDKQKLQWTIDKQKGEWTIAVYDTD